MMMTEMDDPMVLESLLAVRAREKQEAVSKKGVSEISVAASPASGEVTDELVGMESSPPALTHNSVRDDMSKHGVGAQSEAAQEEELALAMKPSEGSRVIDLPSENSTFSCPNLGNVDDIAGEGTGMAQKKGGKRGKNWAPEEMDTDNLLIAFLNTPKVRTRTKHVTDWDAIAKAVPGKTGRECRRRMDGLKRSFRRIEKYCAEHGKEFSQLNEKDILEMKVSPWLTEAWYNDIRDHCPPNPKKKLKTDGAGSSSKSIGFVPGISTLDLQPPVVADRIDQVEPAMVWRLECGVGIQQEELVPTRCQGRSPSSECDLNHVHPVVRFDLDKADIGMDSDRELHDIKANVQGEAPASSL